MIILTFYEQINQQTTVRNSLGPSSYISDTLQLKQWCLTRVKPIGHI